MKKIWLFMLLSCSTACVGKPTQNREPSATSVLIIGHRGACGHRPEHTQASYELAIDFGADFIEPDLVMTKDRFLVVRHENEISQTTDVATKFPLRRTTKVIDGESLTGWFTEDFTLAEIKTLRARERLPRRNHNYDDLYEILTFKEVIQLAQRKAQEKGRVIGIYPEIKHPSYFRSLGMELGTAMLKELRAVGWDQRGSPVFIQSFELSSLKELRAATSLPLIFLVDDPRKRPADFVLANDPRTYGELMTPAGLKEIAAVAQGIGPWKGYIIPEMPDGRLLAPTRLVEVAHAVGLKVHPYTFRSDKDILHPFYEGDPAREYRRFRDLGVDGVFSDFADDAVAALRGGGKTTR